MLWRQRLANINVEFDTIGYITFKIMRKNLLGNALLLVDKTIQRIIYSCDAVFVLLPMMINDISLRIETRKIIIDYFTKLRLSTPQMFEKRIYLDLQKVVKQQF